MVNHILKLIKGFPDGIRRGKFGHDRGYHLFDYTYKYRDEDDFGDRLPHLSGPGLILDWGCNRGIVTSQIASKYPHKTVIGLDINPAYLQDWKNTSNLEFVLGDGYSLPFNERSFDAIFMMNNLAVLADKQPQLAQEKLRIVSEYVKDSGYLLVSYNGSSVIFQKNDDKFNIFSHRRGRDAIQTISETFTDDSLNVTPI